MKLNYKRTFFVGFAFFLICAFWQAYDAIIPLMLVNKFGLNQTVSGIVMALDNILALFMLPLFGALSDKTKTKVGRRTPYILIGTVCAIVCFIGLTFTDYAQINKLGAVGQNASSAESQQILFNLDDNKIANGEYSLVKGNNNNTNMPNQVELVDYVSNILYSKNYSQLTTQQKADVKDWYINKLDLNTVYVYSYDDNTKTATYKVFESSADAKAAGYKLSTNAASKLITPARSNYAWSVTFANPTTLIFFMILLLFTLIAMATFRSPAVALMPDVTIKPLRSKANAVINLMGTAGGMIILGLGMLFGTGKAANQLMSYTFFVVATCGVMLLALAIFLVKVREPKWADEMRDEQEKLGLEEKSQSDTNVVHKLGKSEITSLMLILASVFLWFFGYNAITSKYSLYAVNVLNMDYNTTLLVAQAAAIVSYIPVGMLASKIGRRKSILIGIGLLTIAFGSACFINSSSSPILINVLFALAGIAWATINVNSFPMVVELSRGSDIGKYTGFYYTASMLAQVLTPIVSGAIMDYVFHSMSPLFPYGAIFVAMSFVTMLFVRHGDSKPEQPKDKLEALNVDAD